MSCDEFWNAMPDLVGGTEAVDHLRECPSCAALAERHRVLAAGLKQMAAEWGRMQAPPAVEARLVEAFRSQAGRRAAAGSWAWAAWAAAAAAVIVISVFLVRGSVPRPAHTADAEGAAASAVLDADGSTDFLPLPYGPSGTAGASVTEDADLVRVEVPRSALIALGVPVPVEAGTRVEAVMALDADGMLEGVRILQ